MLTDSGSGQMKNDNIILVAIKCQNVQLRFFFHSRMFDLLYFLYTTNANEQMVECSGRETI